MPTYLPCYCAVIRQASRAVTLFYDSKLAPAGILTTQFTLLQAVKAATDHKTIALAQWLGMDQTTLTRALKKLTDTGLVECNPGADRRVKFWYLTQAGHDRLQQAELLWGEAQQEFKKHFGEEKARQLRDLSVEVADMFFLP
jgi:DNA-binding MarR family transcriptional regulator